MSLRAPLLVRLRPYEGLAVRPRAKAAWAANMSELAPIRRTSQKVRASAAVRKAEEALTKEMRGFQKCKTLG
jgi:hypothetical protein